MSSLVSFGDKFGNEDGEKDLCLSGIRNGGPLVDGLHGGKGFERNIRAQHTREVKSHALDDETGGGNHGASAVLELGSLKPGVSLVTSSIGQSQRIEALDGHGASRLTVKGDTERSACLNITIAID